jgi:hypothetical protein
MKLAMVTPIKDSISGPCHAALVGLAIDLTKKGFDVVHQIAWLSSNLPQARMQLVREALAANADRVLFVDDDILFSPSDFHTLYGAALERKNDLLAGDYKKRIMGGAHVGAPLEGGADSGSLLAMDHVGFGFVLATRACLESMIMAHGDACFEIGRAETGAIVGEDVSFCRKWRAMGGRVWLHTQVNLGHIGPHIFR